MDYVPIIIVIAIFLIVFVAYQRGSQSAQGGDDLFSGTSKAKPHTPAQGIDWAAINDKSVQQHLPHSKIEAIKAYRELTGQGLKESKDAVEYAIAHPDEGADYDKGGIAPSPTDAGVRDLLEAGKFENAVDAYKIFAGVDYFTARNAVEAIQREIEHGAASGISDDEIIDLLSAGKKIEAIKRYREATGLGLKEAKDAVEAIEQFGRRSR
jgi:ribosomal protein L7/L12